MQKIADVFHSKIVIFVAKLQKRWDNDYLKLHIFLNFALKRI